MRKIKGAGFVLLFTIGLFGIVTAQESESVFRDLETSFTYSSDLFVNTTGGFDTGVRYFDNIDVEVGFDLSGFDFHFYGLGNQGGNLSELTGDIQVVSNIEADNSWRIYEAWVNRSVDAIRTSFLFGLYDLNSEFDVINTGGLFMNSSHGIGPEYSSTGELGPSIFPLTSLAFRVKINPIPGVSVKGALLDAVPSDPDNTAGTTILLRESEGALIAGEISFSQPTNDPGSLLDRGIDEESPWRIVLGGWKYSKEREGWLGEKESDHGLYAVLESKLIREKSDADQGLSAFVRVGAANRDINRLNYYLGGGVVYTGPFPSRDADQFGIAVGLPINSDDFVETERLYNNDFTENELNTEVTYLLVISEVISFQLDAQYIMNPNQAPELGDAFAVGLRSTFSF
jgi:porin